MKAYILENNLKPHVQAADNEIVKNPPSTSSTEQIASTLLSKPKAPSTSNIEQNEVDYEDIELSNMRKVIAKRLLFSKVIQFFRLLQKMKELSYFYFGFRNRNRVALL